MDLDRISDVEVLRSLLKAQLKESERLKAELKSAYEQLRGKDEKKAEQLALRLAEVERQHAKALTALFGPSSERRRKDDKTEAKAKARLPFGRLVDPAEVARAAAFICSDDAGLMTGAVVNFDQSIWGAYAAAPVPAGPMTIG